MIRDGLLSPLFCGSSSCLSALLFGLPVSALWWRRGAVKISQPAEEDDGAPVLLTRCARGGADLLRARSGEWWRCCEDAASRSRMGCRIRGCGCLRRGSSGRERQTMTHLAQGGRCVRHRCSGRTVTDHERAVMGDMQRRAPLGDRGLVGDAAARTRGPRPTGHGGAPGADGPFDGPTGASAARTAGDDDGGGFGGWQERAACRGQDPDLWFPGQGGSVRAAKRVCRVCPVQINCLAEAMKRDELYGVWGGASEDERRQFRTALRNKRGGGVHGADRVA
ncbi:WhiB family transcriptional regulator [Nocardiopsis quinghaiensis]|uniref:WhiB family transcriptional regulator n=1 Tax=Nocardiopsis quinghaiensis TaxID=464995 RepID=UPI00295877DB|nr:WhiB family transcriptional regulator [Nocardiopsis quinghaiensis]